MRRALAAAACRARSLRQQALQTLDGVKCVRIVTLALLERDEGVARGEGAEGFNDARSKIALVDGAVRGGNGCSSSRTSANATVRMRVPLWGERRRTGRCERKNDDVVEHEARCEGREQCLHFEARETEIGGQGEQIRISGQVEDPAQAPQGSSGTWERQQ